jgi:hypothetical protein
MAATDPAVGSAIACVAATGTAAWSAATAAPGATSAAADAKAIDFKKLILTMSLYPALAEQCPYSCGGST